MTALHAIPTNIITGFLGVGKTSTILHLLQHKPDNERWAVLVNEFGEVGLDGTLLKTSGGIKQVYIYEIPGGCMCCAAGVPMQIALNQLLSKAKPDRLLIEPTGLGHPIEIIQTLSNDYYADILSLQKIITLVDARKLSDNRYTQHPTFNQQLAIADIIIANKKDLYSSYDNNVIHQYIHEKANKDIQFLFANKGKIPINLLNGKTTTKTGSCHSHLANTDKLLAADMPIPESGYLQITNQGENYYSTGWRFAPDKVFDRKKLLLFIHAAMFERLKAVFITNDGIFAYNVTADAAQEWLIDDCMESRIEIIAMQRNQQWHQDLMACISD